MVIRSRLRSGLSAMLLALLCVSVTGLPSHGHTDERPDGELPVLNGVDHHEHAVTLVEWTDQAPSTDVQFVAIHTSPTVLTTPSYLSVRATPTTSFRPRERAPPPGAPRAPPRTI